MVTTSDPRRGVGQIERRERERHDARLALEREELLKAATSKWVAHLVVRWQLCQKGGLTLGRVGLRSVTVGESVTSMVQHESWGPC